MERFIRASVHLIFSLALVVALGAPLVRAGDTTDEQKAETKLSAAIFDTFEYKDEKLKTVIQAVAEKAGVSILLDDKNVKGNELLVTIELSSISAKNALDLVLQQKSLTRQFRDGVINVTTADAAKASPVLVIKLYDVRDITAPVKDFKAPKIGLKGEGEKAKNDDDDDKKAEDKTITVENLIETITSTIESDVWDSNGWSVKPIGGQLSISATTAVHKQIAELLDGLRANK